MRFTLPFVVVWVLLVPAPSFACSCSTPTTKQVWDWADSVLIGKVVQLSIYSESQRGKTGAIRVEVIPSEVLKGEASGKRWVGFTPIHDGMCGFTFNVAWDYLIFAAKEVPLFRVLIVPPTASLISSCQGTGMIGSLPGRRLEEISEMVKRR